MQVDAQGGWRQSRCSMAWRRRSGRAVLAAALCLAALLAPVVAPQAGRSRERIVTKLHGIWVCPDVKHHVKIHNATVLYNPTGGDYMVVDFNMAKAMNDISKVLITIFKCQGGTAAALCETFLRWSWVSRVCSTMAAKDTFWTYTVDSIEPRWRCPLQAGDYHVSNLTINFKPEQEFIKRINIEKSTWKLKLQMFNELSELVLCGSLVADVRRVRVKDPS